jgi:hypothetical protein
MTLFVHAFALYFFAVFFDTPSSRANGRIFSPAAVRFLIASLMANGNGEPRLAILAVLKINDEIHSDWRVLVGPFFGFHCHSLKHCRKHYVALG